MYARQILIFAYLRVYFSKVRKHVKSLRHNLIVTDFADEEHVERYCNGIFPHDNGTFVDPTVNPIDTSCVITTSSLFHGFISHG